MEDKKIVEVSNLNKSFKGNHVFKDFSMSISEKKITTIFGASGSGKSTILNIIGLLEPYNTGSLRIFEKEAPNINSRKAMLLRRTQIGYLFQNFGLIESSTIEKNLDVGLHYEHLSSKSKKEKMEWSLDQVGLNKNLKERIYNLSGGEQQRVAIARILVKPSKLILADEPTGSLDCKNRDYIMKKLEEIKDMGKTVVIVSHDPKFREISENFIIINKKLTK